MKSGRQILCLIAFAVLALAAAPAWAGQQAGPGVSLASAFQQSGGSSAAIARKWNRVLAQIAPGTTACPAGQRHCEDWQALKMQLASVSDRLTLLKQVNDAVNRLQYVSDSQQWALKDYWATPVEFFARRAGDCEDYAISKYFLLGELGVPVQAMRIAIVHDTARNLTHAVLVVQTDRGPMMLDNVIEEVLPAAAVPQYRTLLALNQGSMSTYLATSGSSAAGQQL